MRLISPEEKKFRKMVNDLSNYIRENNLKSLILGISGGIDSALVACIAHNACRAEGIPLKGVWIQIESNKEDEYHRAKLVGEAFCSEFLEMDLTKLYKMSWDAIGPKVDPDISKERARLLALGENHEPSIETKIRQGNMKARLRMITLYDYAQANNGMVLSTDNWTEYLLGFWTLHGDVGDFGPIQKLWKTQVYEIASYASIFCLGSVYDKGDLMSVALSECVLATPTDGLGISNSDLEQLGVDSYEEVDEILKYIENMDMNSIPNFIKQNPVVNRHIRTEFKRLTPISVQFEE